MAGINKKDVLETIVPILVSLTTALLVVKFKH